MELGYKRVSSIDQSTERQLENIKLDRVFEDVYIIYLYILDSNIKSKRFVSGIGFKCDGKLRKHVNREEDLIIYSLTKEEYENVR